MRAVLRLAAGERTSIGHVLNTKAVARRYAREQGRRYEEMRLIVVHMGSGITVSAHRGGRMIDSNSIEEGRSGRTARARCRCGR